MKEKNLISQKSSHQLSWSHFVELLKIGDDLVSRVEFPGTEIGSRIVAGFIQHFKKLIKGATVSHQLAGCHISIGWSPRQPKVLITQIHDL